MKSAEFELAPTNVERPQTGLVVRELMVERKEVARGARLEERGGKLAPTIVGGYRESMKCRKGLVFRGLEGTFLKNVCMRLMMSEIGEDRSKDLIFRRLGRFFRIFHLIFRRRDLIFRGLHKIPGYKRHLNAECEARNAEFKKGIHEIIEEFESG